MNNSPFRIILRFVLIYLLQVMVFKNMNVKVFDPYAAETLVFPLFLATLPTRTTPQLCILLGFLSGFLLDISYNTWGVHAASGAFAGYMRLFALRRIEPKGGFGSEIIPNIHSLGWRPFLIYYGLFLAVYLVFHYSMVMFTPYYLLDILVKSALSYLISMVFGVVLSLIMRF
jgi:hypothetical protein